MVHMPPWALCSDGSSYEATKYDASLAWNPVDRKQTALKSASAFTGSAHIEACRIVYMSICDSSPGFEAH